MKSIIVAYDQNRGIGASNDLLWTRDLPADLAHFKQITTGHVIITGRKTFDSIGRALPNRRNIVISHEASSVEGVEFVTSLEEAYELAADEDIFVIGGGQIYDMAINTVDRLLVTEVDGTFDAQVFFPAIDPESWVETAREHHAKDDLNKYNYDFVTYARR